ncbi:MAG: arsenate reductase (glutaredoxin) [SAR324 cluster bacterium]|nr:arsenate reductase (glutaredoxin) [SAR324 cluster bacterium]
MSTVTIWHNPKCSKSRQTLELLQSKGIEPVIFEYLKEPITPEILKEVWGLLGKDYRAVMRTKEEAYKELNLGDPSKSDADLIQAAIQNPKIIERPVVICGKKAAIGRPPEAVLEIL